MTGTALLGDNEYNGPKPAKKDLPYLQHGDRLIETERKEASQLKTKDGDLFSVSGATSPARTPLPEPIFVIQQDQIRADQLGLFRFEVRGQNREVIIGKKRKNDDEQVLRLTIRQLSTNLYRLESAQSLDPGEYALSPEGQNVAFCFTVY
jgi:hypothetical protein